MKRRAIYHVVTTVRQLSATATTATTTDGHKLQRPRTMTITATAMKTRKTNAKCSVKLI